MKKMSLLVLLLFIASCATNEKLTAQGAKVKFQKSDPPAKCKEIGELQATISMGTNLAGTKNKIRNRAAKMGANYVRWETVSKSEITGTGFMCP